MAIKAVRFDVTQQNKDAYRLSADFLGEDGKSVSSSGGMMIFRPGMPRDGVTVDVFTKNATGKSGSAGKVMKQIFQRKEKEDVPVLEAVKASMDHPFIDAGKRQVVAVFDINDSGAKYENLPQIGSCQEVAMTYLSDKDGPLVDKAPDTHRSLKELGVEFVVGEGPLKYHLLRDGLLTPAQMEFFLSPDGKIYHCQFAEFVMDGFKRGYSAQGEGKSGMSFRPDDYVFSVVPGKRFEPLNRSVVFFPPEYKGVYGAAEPPPVVTAMRKVCPRVELAYNPQTQISMMKLAEI